MSEVLKSLQLQMAHAIRAGGEAGKLLTARRDGGPARLEIYRAAYGARLTEALRDNFPILARVLGDDSFDELARAYIDAEPSRQASIRWFGASLPSFMRAEPDLAGHAALIDLARMEWALGTTFDAPDAPGLQVEHLGALAGEDWPGLRFDMHPSVQMLELEWAVEPIWRTLSLGEDSELPPPEPLPHALLVWRPRLETLWRSLDAEEATLLAACVNRCSFAQLCELAAQSAQDPAACAAGHLRAWVEAGLLGNFVTETGQRAFTPALEPS